MAYTDPYATAAQYRARVALHDGGDDDEILDDLTAISRYIEFKTGRVFNKDVAAVNHHVYGNDLGYLDIGDWVSITSVTEDSDDDGDFADETALASTEYELYPLNATNDGNPYTRLYIPSWSDQGTWLSTHKYRIVGVRGWPVVPAAIRRATVELTAILRLETPRATARIPEGIEESVGVSQQAQSIIYQLLQAYGGTVPSWGFV